MTRCANAALLAAIVLSLGCVLAAQAPAPGALAIQKVEPMSVAGAQLYYRVVVAYLPEWQRGAFSFLVNGKPAPFMAIPTEAAANENSRAFQIYLGEPGHKRIEVTAKLGEQTVQAAAELDFQAKGGMVLLGHYDGEVLTGDEEVSVLAYFMRDAQVRLNGDALPAATEPVPGMDGVYTLTDLPKLKPGINVIECSGTDRAGQSFDRKFSIYLMQDRKVRLGDQFGFVYGVPKMTDADPEISLQITGDALAVDGASQKVPIYGLDGAWLAEINVLVQPLVARHVGSSKLDMVAEYSTGYRNTTTLVVAVEPAGDREPSPQE